MFERRKTRPVLWSSTGSERPGGGRRPDLDPVDDHHQNRGRRGHAGPDLRSRGRRCDIVRCTCNEEAAAEGLAQIVPRSLVPIIADIHFQHRLALAAMEAGVAGLRLNPGTSASPSTSSWWPARRRTGPPIRIGVNGESRPGHRRAVRGATPEALVASAERELAYFREVDFEDVKISVKASNVSTMIDAYRLLADTVDYPLHLGVTEAGPPRPVGESTPGSRRCCPRESATPSATR